MVRLVGKQKGGWHPGGMAGEGVEGSDLSEQGGRQVRRPWRREAQTSVGSDSVRSSGKREHAWIGRGVWGCWSAREEG